MKEETVAGVGLKTLIYCLFSLYVFVSILVWPLLDLQMFEFWSNSLVDRWSVYIGILIIMISVIDSFVEGVVSSRIMLSHAAWVIAMSFTVFKSYNHANSMYLLGVLWFVHALRSFPALWTGASGWWLWPAWIRDCAVPVVIFFLYPRLISYS